MIRCTGRLLCYVPLVCYDTGGASLSLGIGRTVVNSVVDSISYPFLIIIVIIKILVVAVRTQNHRNIEHIRWDGWLVGWLFIVIATKQSYYLLSDHHTTSTNETNEKCFFFVCCSFVNHDICGAKRLEMMRGIRNVHSSELSKLPTSHQKAGSTMSMT